MFFTMLDDRRHPHITFLNKKIRKHPVTPRSVKIFNHSEFCISTIVFKFWV